MNKKFMLLAAALMAVFSTGCKPDDVNPEEPAPAPELTAINPTSGYVADEAVITGKNFSETASENEVFFGNAKAEIKTASATELKVVIPDNPVGKVDLKVTVDGKTAEGLSFTYLQKVLPMSVSGITPAEGSVGADVVISGANFGTSADDLIVLFGEKTATVKSVTETAITVTVPEGNGEVAVIVSLGDQISDPVMFTYVYAREVTYTSMTPTIATYGDEIKIFGTGFPEAVDEISASVNGVTAAVTAATAEGIIVSVPELPVGDYKVKVSVTGAAPFETDAFAYYTLPEYTVSTVLGDGTAKNKEGVWTDAQLQLPEGLCWAPDGSMWITTRGGSKETGAHAIHKVNMTTGQLETVADQSVIGVDQYPWGGSFNSKGEFHVCHKAKNVFGKYVEGEYETYGITGTTIKTPMNVVFDSKDYMYIADRDNKRIAVAHNGNFVKEYKIMHGGFEYQPYTVALDLKEENLFVGTNGGRKLFMINISSGNVTKIAGVDVEGSTDGKGLKPAANNITDGDAGNPMTAVVGSVSGIVVAENGYLYFNDIEAYTFRVLIPGVGGDYTKGVVKTLAGQPCSSGFADGNGLTEAKFVAQGMLLMDKEGSFYIAGGNANRIRKVTPVK